MRNPKVHTTHIGFPALPFKPLKNTDKTKVNNVKNRLCSFMNLDVLQIH